MSHSFNADYLLEDVMMGLGKRCTGPMPAFLPYYDSSIPPLAYDLEKAKSLKLFPSPQTLMCLLLLTILFIRLGITMAFLSSKLSPGP